MPRARLDAAGLARLIHGATLVRTSPAVFRIEGPGAVQCLQGLVTNEVEKPGPGSLTWNALLTAKGMIVLDLWALRDATGFTLVMDAAAREDALALFAKSLPPRLATLTDRTGELKALWMVGAAAAEHCSQAGMSPLPNPGHAGVHQGGRGEVAVAVATGTSWFTALFVGAPADLDELAGNLQATGVVEGSGNDMVAARVLAGWPALGAEMTDKTLPQEARFDELGGVSYTKGCYLGQETVARVHFRGHPNRELRGLVWDAGDALTGMAIAVEGREVGTIRSILELPDRRLALAPIRREVELGTLVTAGGQPARVVALPFDPGAAAA